jgi:hypothetical protein
MTTFLSQSDLADSGLTLFLSNDLGQPQNAFSVRWTVFSMYTGQCISGQNIDAINANTGEYRAPWFTDTKTGSYKVIWEIQENWETSSRQISQPFFVVDPSDYRYGLHLKQDTVPVPGSLTFLTGSYLGTNDLFVVLRDQDGFLQDAYSVLWYIKNLRGCAITQRVFGVHTSTGVYYAPWVVIVGTGNYEIVWEYQDTQNSPLKSISQQFTILGSAAPFMLVTGPACSDPTIIAGYDKNCRVNASQLSGSSIRWGGNSIYEIESPINQSSHPCRRYTPPACSMFPIPPVIATPSRCCGGYEITRQIHLATTVLPLNGIYTSQNKFPVPTGVKKITFYITYTRGAPGGYAVFRLLWGNGVEEIQETVLDMDMVDEGNDAHVGQNLFAQDLFGPSPNDDNPLSFILYTSVPGGVTTARLIAAERGMPLQPGIIGITLTAST